MNFTDYCSESKQLLVRTLTTILQDLDKQVVADYPELLVPFRLFTDSMFGGKMLRGTLIRLGYHLANPKENTEIFKVAAAFEIFHSSLLVHDDIIDKSPLRRGQPTLYKALGSNHYGLSQAICLGDLGFYLTTKIITDSKFADSSKNKALGFFSQVIIKTIYGEMLDVLPLETSLTQLEVIKICLLKTANYSVMGPLILGSLLGGAKQPLTADLGQFGENLGIAYQIQDDILGVFGTEEELGKSVTSDISEGKKTVLAVYALQNATSTQKAMLDRLYGKRKITKIECKVVKKVFEDTGALSYSQELAQQYIDKAKETIPKLSQNVSTKKLLEQLADMIIKRQN